MHGLRSVNPTVHRSPLNRLRSLNLSVCKMSYTCSSEIVNLLGVQVLVGVIWPAGETLL